MNKNRSSLCMVILIIVIHAALPRAWADIAPDTNNWQYWAGSYRFDPIYPEKQFPPAPGVFEATPEGLRAYGNVYRGDAFMITANFYSLRGKTLSLKWKANGGGGFMGVGPMICPPNGLASMFCYGLQSNTLTTHHSFNGSALIGDDVWYYTRLVITEAGAAHSTTAVGDYDGQLIDQLNFSLGADDSFQIALYFFDFYGSTSVYTMIGEARLDAQFIPAAGVRVLNPSASNALVASGSAAVVTSGEIIVNSSAPKALVVSGGATVTASAVRVVGGYTAAPSAVTPSPQPGATPVADPLADLQAPSHSGCDYTNAKVSGGMTTLNPGVYCGGLSISSAVVTFNPGTYILNGGGLTISGGSSSVSGNDVTFYNTSTGYDYKPITISGGAKVNLSAPTSGSLAGVLFFQDRSITSSSQNTISGGSGGVLAGALYFPTTKLVYSGGSGSGGKPTMIIADRVQFSGPSYLQ